MPISFTCPKCNKTLRVKDDLAGKKGQCPGCQHRFVIPTSTSLAATKVTAPAGNAEGMADLEQLAVAALTESQAQEQAAAPEELEFTCPQCDEKVKVGVDLAGKRSPCPSCRRIVQVPNLAPAQRKDWRQKAPNLPSLAKREVETLEGAWGTEAVSRVSQEALEEARAIKRVRKPWSAAQIVSWSSTLLVLALVGWIGWGMVQRYRQAGFQKTLLASVEKQLNSDAYGRMPALVQMELPLVLSVYYRTYARNHQGPLDDQRDGRAQLAAAVQAIERLTDPIDRWVALRTFFRFAGSEPDFDAGQVGRALAMAPGTDAKYELLREYIRDQLASVAASADAVNLRAEHLRKVIEQAMPAINARGEPDNTEMLGAQGLLGQGLKRVGQTDLAKRTAQEAFRQFQPGSYPRPLASLLASFGMPELQVPKETKALDRPMAMARVEFLLQDKKLDAALAEMDKNLREPTLERATMLIGFAQHLADEKQPDYERQHKLLADAADIARRFPDETAWHRCRICEVATALGHPDQAEAWAKEFLPPGHALRLTFEGQLSQALAAKQGLPDAALAGLDLKDGALGILLYETGKEKARQIGWSAQAWTESLTEPWQRALAEVGMLQAMEEKRR